jgi:cytoskeletal protein RodZ
VGRHASPGKGRFFRELGVFTLKVLFWGVIVFGGVLLLQKAIDWFASPTTTTIAAVETTSTTQAVDTTTSAPSTTVEATTVTTPATTTTAPVTTTTLRAPADISVQVLNSTTRSGIAASLTDQLVAAGFQTIDADNYSHALDQSQVWYAKGYEAEARALAAEYIPDAAVDESPGPLDVDILVVIGDSYQE